MQWVEKVEIREILFKCKKNLFLPKVVKYWNKLTRELVESVQQTQLESQNG